MTTTSTRTPAALAWTIAKLSPASPPSHFSFFLKKNPNNLAGASRLAAIAHGSAGRSRGLGRAAQLCAHKLPRRLHLSERSAPTRSHWQRSNHNGRGVPKGTAAGKEKQRAPGRVRIIMEAEWRWRKAYAAGCYKACKRTFSIGSVAMAGSCRPESEVLVQTPGHRRGEEAGWHASG